MLFLHTCLKTITWENTCFWAMYRSFFPFQLSSHTAFFWSCPISLSDDFKPFFSFIVIASFCGTFHGTTERRRTSKSRKRIIHQSSSKKRALKQQVLSPFSRETTPPDALTMFQSNRKLFLLLFVYLPILDTIMGHSGLLQPALLGG